MVVNICEFFPTLFQNRFSGSFANAGSLAQIVVFSHCGVAVICRRWQVTDWIWQSSFAHGEVDIAEGAALHLQGVDEGAQQLEGAGGIVERIVPAGVGGIADQGGY